ncbi:MAG: ATP phosphoribosyltransferase regulatory subunit, partial [Phycisphaerales bacterium]|nr:ATP phosphoribosyltransferase regulatory subunit [Phycisphaerales bacterium]
MAPSSNKSAKSIQPPKGTRDLYPDDVLKRRYIQNAWRDASLRCGFDEIEGPTFESTDLYSVKSGEGILSELFQTFSGKGGQETLDKLVANGKADFALRPEFTPTLARMYAARAKQLPKPCKWFTAGPYFRAERPQRGRLREFLQWNCDIIGLPSDEDTPQTRAQMDAETIESCVNLLVQLGISTESLRIKVNDRLQFERFLTSMGVKGSQLDGVFALVDKVGKLTPEKIKQESIQIGLPESVYSVLFEQSKDDDTESYLRALEGRPLTSSMAPKGFEAIASAVDATGLNKWCDCDPFIVRGLAYYT